MGNIEAGSVTPLAVTTTERSKALPDVPTVSEELEGYNVPYWTAIFAPAGTPKEVLDKVAKATKAVVNSPETAQRLKELGVDGIGSTPEELDSFWHEQLAYFQEVIEDADIQMGN
jgi:tripartite-type tricarboxylate transporter receptor subunit TctC